MNTEENQNKYAALHSSIHRLKSSVRLSQIQRAHMVFEIMTTNKTYAVIAREFGISTSAVARFAKRLSAMRSPLLFFRSDGSSFWLENTKESFFRRSRSDRRAHGGDFSREVKK